MTENLIPALREDPERVVAAHPTSTTRRSDYIDRVTAGGFPLAITRAPAARDRWFDNDVTQSIERDSQELVRVRQKPVTCGHWRTQDDDEVDFVIEFDDGDVLAFEVKAAERVSGKGFTGLRKLRDALGSRFVAGVTLSTGPRSYTHEDRLHVMPLDRLWTPVPGR